MRGPEEEPAQQKPPRFTETTTVRVEEPHPGDVINGRYRIERLLGEGGLGNVYLARDLVKAHQLVALKMLRPSQLSEDQLALLENEFETMARLSHPNIAAVYDFGHWKETDLHFLTMEYVEGQPLHKVCTDLQWPQLLDLFVQVCRALAYMHSRAVIHFDLKPANILVTAQNKVKVLDFGLAGTRAYRLGRGELLGSPAYMAPELILAPGTADHRVDLYSLGIIAYQTLTGRLPFQCSTLTELLRAHCYAPVEFDKAHTQTIPAWLRRIVQRLCAKNPSDRFATANAVIEAINRDGGMTYEIETRQTRQSYLLSSRFVARQNEYATVLAHIERLLKGDFDGNAVLFVTGVSGIGKSRLLREIRYHLQLTRRTFVEANCYEGSLSEFAPIVEIVRHWVAMAESRGDARLASYGPDLAQLDPQLGQEKGWVPMASSENASADRIRLIQRVVDFLLDGTGDDGIVVYVNDLQWALPGTIDILSHLVRRLISRWESGDRVKFCLLGSYREDELSGTPLEAWLGKLRRINRCREIILQPLTAKDVGEMLSSMLGLGSVPTWFVQRVYEESGGNPYFVEELMRMLVEMGDVYVQDDQLIVRKEDVLRQLPHTVADALMRRFSSLERFHRKIVELMALHARPVPAEVLHAVIGGELYALQQALQILVRRRMLTLQPGPTPLYRIAHDRLRESVCDATPERSRKKLHEEWLRGLSYFYSGKEEEVIYDLARHAWEAGDTERSLRYSIQAGDQAYREFANHLGILLYNRVLDLLPQKPSIASRTEILEKLGEMYFRTGQYEQAMRCYQQVLEASTDPLTKARLLRKQAVVHITRGQLRNARETLWAAASELGAREPFAHGAKFLHLLKALIEHLLYTHGRIRPFIVTDSATRARLEELCAIYLRLGYVYYFVDPLRMLLPLLRCCNLGERLGESPQLCHVYSAMGVLYGTVGQFKTAARLGEAAIAMATRLGLPWHMGQAYEYRGMVLYFMGEFEEAIATLHRAKDLLRERGDLFELEVCYIHLALSLLLMGRYLEAQALSEEGLQAVEESSAMLLGKNLRHFLSLARARLGHFEGGLEAFETVFEMCRTMGDVLDMAANRVYTGQFLLLAGDTDRAIQALETARKIRDEHHVLQEYSCWVYSLLVRAYWDRFFSTFQQTGQPMSPETRQYLRSLSRKALLHTQFGNRTGRSPAWIARGIAHWLDGETHTARRCFRKGLEVARFQRAGQWLSEGYYEIGRCYLLNPVTRQEGIRYLQQAEALFSEQRCTPYLERTRALLAAVERTSTPFPSLSSHEGAR